MINNVTYFNTESLREAKVQSLYNELLLHKYNPSSSSVAFFPFRIYTIYFGFLILKLGVLFLFYAQSSLLAVTVGNSKIKSQKSPPAPSGQQTEIKEELIKDRTLN